MFNWKSQIPKESPLDVLKFPGREQIYVECDIENKEFLILQGKQRMQITLEEVPTVISLLAESLRQWGERRT